MLCYKQEVSKMSDSGKTQAEKTSEELSALLTPKQRRFAMEYLVDWNGTQAAVRAGVKPGKNNASAAVAASRMLKNDNVAAYIRARQRETFDALGLSPEAITLRLVDVLNQCMEGTERLTWDSETHSYIPDGTWNFDSKGATKALQLLGDSIGMFEHKVKVSGGISLEEYLKQQDTENGDEF